VNPTSGAVGLGSMLTLVARLDMGNLPVENFRPAPPVEYALRKKMLPLRTFSLTILFLRIIMENSS